MNTTGNLLLPTLNAYRTCFHLLKGYFFFAEWKICYYLNQKHTRTHCDRRDAMNKLQMDNAFKRGLRFTVFTVHAMCIECLNLSWKFELHDAHTINWLHWKAFEHSKEFPVGTWNCLCNMKRNHGMFLFIEIKWLIITVLLVPDYVRAKASDSDRLLHWIHSYWLVNERVANSPVVLSVLCHALAWHFTSLL